MNTGKLNMLVSASLLTATNSFSPMGLVVSPTNVISKNAAIKRSGLLCKTTKEQLKTELYSHFIPRTKNGFVTGPGQTKPN